tara:strand:- start:105 stop:488 length:384 start_codon:yes stop_codon:yes gene_type:complete
VDIRAIALYTTASIVLVTASGIPFGVLAARGERAIESPLYQLLQYSVAFLVRFSVFYRLFTLILKAPILSAILIAVLSYSISVLAFYWVTGIRTPLLLIYIDALLNGTAMCFAAVACKSRGTFGIRA